MAVFRMFYINFWRDAFVVDLTPEEKYFYIYIMTNPNTNQCGIYQISKKTMGFETGFNTEEIDNLLDKLNQCGYIDYCEKSKEIMITNWIRQNFINSPNNIKSLNGELKKVVNKGFLQKFYDICADEEYPLDKIFQGIKLNYVNTQEHCLSNSLNNDLNTEAIVENNASSILHATSSNTSNSKNASNSAINASSIEDVTNPTLNTINTSRNTRNVANTALNGSNTLNSSNTALNTIDDLRQATTETEDPLIPLESSSAFEKLDSEFKHLIKLFSSNIHPITPLEYVKLYNWTKDIEPEAIEIAILEAVNHNARSMSYINCILNSWLSLGIKSKSQVENYQKEWNEKQNKSKGFQDCNGKYYCIPNVSAYDYVEFPEFENDAQ